MRTLFLYFSLALYLTTCHSSAQMAQDRRPPQNAISGDVATGEVMTEEGGRLQLNTRPCDRDKVVIIFRKPYVKEAVGNVKCGGDVKKLVQVVQK